MTFRSVAAPFLAALVAAPAVAQDDRVVMTNGTVVQGVKVTAFDVRSLRYTKGSANEQVPTDQVAKIELGKFKDVFARGLKDPDLMLTVAREQLAEKNVLMAQLGFVGSAIQFFDANEASKAVSALDELQKALPEAGVIPEVYRQKFEFYMGQGSKGAGSAATVAKKYASDATANAWPSGFAVEADFFNVLAERKDPKDFQNRLRGIVGKAAANAVIANRANVQLANSLRETNDVDGATKIYEDIVRKEGVDESARAGALLGLGKVIFDKAPAGDKEAFKKAMLMFLRVRLETKDAWPALHAEALYHAILAAQKWGGPEYTLVMGRCRRELTSEFPGSEWAERAKAGR